MDVSLQGHESVVSEGLNCMGNFRRALGYFREDLPRVIAALSMIAAGTFLGVLGPWPLAILIDQIGNKPAETAWQRDLVMYFIPTTSSVTIIIGLAVAAGAIGLTKEMLQMFQTFLNIRIGYMGDLRVRADLFSKLQALHLGFHKSQPQGDTIYRLTRDTGGFGGTYKVFTGALINGLTLGFMVWFMVSINWKLTLVALCVVPVLLGAIKYFARKMQSRSMAAYEQDAQMYTTIQRSVGSIGLVQAFSREQEEYTRFRGSATSTVQAYLRLHWQEVLYWFVLGSTICIGSSVILGVGGYLAVTGRISAGELFVFVSYLGMLYSPLSALVGSNQGFQNSMAGVKRVFEVLDRDPVIKDAPGAKALPMASRTLELRDVCFSYRENTPVLIDINAKVQPGEMVAFVGSSGVGKSTLLNLFPRFYDPSAGSLLLDDVDVRSIRLRDLRKHIALVLQESVILPASVSENIAYGRPDATEADIVHAAELAGAASFIDKLPNKYAEMISESGSNLSGGQRQRISIARALLTNAPIMVLDEPTSALDPQHEQMITETLGALKRKRTILLVSHRLSTVADCDRIYVMDQGKIVEQGTHDQLLAKRGLYYTMARHQLRLDDDVPAAEQPQK